MPDEVWKYLQPAADNELFIDATLGEGGHAELFLSASPTLRLVGLDADREILKVAENRLSKYGERARLYNRWFNTFFKEYPLGDERPDKILFDLGISSFHYARGERGFSFQKDEPLDMRLDTALETSAFDIVNEYPEKELADILMNFGEERYSYRIAAAVVRRRKEKPIETTGELRDIVVKAVPAKYRNMRIHPATRTFQALRIAVNGELVRLSSGLEYAYAAVKPGGRIGVISFHSLEDRIVKNFFKEKSKVCSCPPEWPQCKCDRKRKSRIITKKPVEAGSDEREENPRSRSAKFRVLEKIEDEVF